MAAAAQIFGLELEGLSPEDKEFELTRSFVRLAADAVRHAAAAALPPSVPPQAIASRAATEAARHWAPGLLGAGVRPPAGSAEQQEAYRVTLDALEDVRDAYGIETGPPGLDRQDEALRQGADGPCS